MEPLSSAPPNSAHSNPQNIVNQQPSSNEETSPMSLPEVLPSPSVNPRDKPDFMSNRPAGLDQSTASVNFLNQPPLPTPRHPADELPAPHEDVVAASTPDPCRTDTDGSINPAEGSNGLTGVSLAKVEQDSDSDNEGTVILIRELLDSAKQDVECLHTAIFSLQDALKSESLADTDRPRVRYYLIKAVITRYGLYGWLEDLEVGFGNLIETVKNIDELRALTQERDEDMNELQVASQLIQACRNSINIDTLNSVVCIAEEDLKLSMNDRPGLRNLEILIELGNALVMSYLHHGQTSALDLAMAKFQEAISSAEFGGHTPLRYVSALSLVYVELLRLMECGDIEAMHRLRAYWTEARGIERKAEDLYQMGTQWQRMSEVSDEQFKTAIALLDDCTQCRMTPHPRRAVSLNELGVTCFMRFQREGDFQDLKKSIICHREAVVLQPAPHPRRALSLNNLANALSTRFEQNGAFKDLEECILLRRQALSLHPLSPTHYSVSLTNLAAALFIRFEQKGAFQDLDESISLYQEVFNRHPASHPVCTNTINNLANALLARFKQKGGSQDFEKGVVLYREALDLAAPRNRSRSLNSLATALYIGFHYMGASEDLDQCILLFQEALNLDPPHHPTHSMTLNNLGNALWARFKHKGVLQDLDECILFHQKALSLYPAPHPNRSTSLNNLANALFTHFRQKGAFQDLNECICLYGEALKLRPAPHPDRSASLNNLANALRSRFEQKGYLQDLDECIVLHQEALRLQTTSHPDYSTSLSGLAVALSDRFKEKGDYKDLDHCILLHRDILKLQHAPHPDRSSTLDNLPNELITRFKQKETFQDLDVCVLLQQDVLGSQPTSHSNHSSFLNNLAVTLFIRYKHKGILQDLEECVTLYRQALSLHSVQHPDRPKYLNNLAAALLACFQRNGTSSDLEECILIYREALNLHSAPHPNRSKYLHNLATTLLTRFKQNGTSSDLEECILLHREALSLHSAPHPSRSISLDHLASALLAYFEQRRDCQLEVLDECILLYQEALLLRPAPHPSRLLPLNNLASVLLICYEHKGALKNCNLALLSPCDSVFRNLASQPDSLQDDMVLQTALNCFEAASKYQTGSLFDRVQAAKHWALYAQKYHSFSALHAYQYAMSLIPLLASLDLTLQQRQDVLQNTQALVGNSASFAITADQYEMAVVFLATGCSVFWAQALRLRTPIDKLAVMHPALAERFSTLSKRLEEASFYNQHLTSDLDSSLHLSQDESLYTLADQQHHIIGEIRKTPGFEEFLQPPSFALLQSAASQGPIVLLNASESGCDALILHEKKPIEHIPLLDICLEELQALKGLFHTLMQARTRAIVISKDATNILQKLLKRDMVLEDSSGLNQGTFQSALGCLWTRVVQPVIGALALNKSSSPSRIWWCPAGPFSSFPIHAAGIYSENNDPVDCLFEYAVTSYCTSPQDLLHPSPKITKSFKMTAIIEPNAPGTAPLPATLEELREIERHVPNHQQHLTAHIGSKNTPTSFDDILSSIQKSSFTHFGCHGMQHLNNPLESSLLLNSGRLTMSKIIQECKVPEGALAYLSACETAKGDEARPNESLNLVATMMFAGFRSVVGTMWSIFDEDAPVVADVFYGHLFRNRENALPDVRDAAYGLHLATEELRRQGRSFQSWVPYVHYGI